MHTWSAKGAMPASFLTAQSGDMYKTPLFWRYYTLLHQRPIRHFILICSITIRAITRRVLI
jgi:hypothetical protein